MYIRYLIGLTVFLAAYLVIQIEPLSGKIVTARLGGSASIWSVCLLFFQLVVLAGYLLTFLICKLNPKQQAVVYILLAAGSLLFLRLPPPELWLPQAGLDPVGSLLLLLTVNLAAPCIFLSSISGMLQNWYAQLKLGNPYPLYSISNAGSLSALLAYPTVVEPQIGVALSIELWRWFYLLLLGFTVLIALFVCRLAGSDWNQSTGERTDETTSIERFLVWLFLSALGSTTLLVYTTYLTQDIAPVPLLWVVPLSIYLITFILCFASPKTYLRRVLLFLAPALCVLQPCFRSTPALDLLAVLSLIFTFCMVCHGELVRRKPSARNLPLFYLAVALGGAVGGLFVNIVAPLVFDSYVERGLIGWCMIALTVKAYWKDDLRFFPRRWLDAVSIIVLVYSLALINLTDAIKPGKSVLWKARNFYGCLSIISEREKVNLVNGSIVHGFQYRDRAFQSIPTQYYARCSGAGWADDCWRRKHPGMKVRYGLVGLGAGTMAAYANPGDTVVFYEIDPKVQEAAQKYFSFLRQSHGKVSILSGDARITLSAQAPQNYDYLLVDAFNGDAIPVHLLTKEAIQIYLKHLAPDGILLVHISNSYVNLEPVLANIAEQLGLTAQYIRSLNGRYVVITRRPLVEAAPFLDDHEYFTNLTIEPAKGNRMVGVWTDDYSNIYAILKRR